MFFFSLFSLGGRGGGYKKRRWNVIVFSLFEVTTLLEYAHSANMNTELAYRARYETVTFLFPLTPSHVKKKVSGFLFL